MFKVSRRCFCAFCRSPRLVYHKRHVSILDVLLSLLAAVLMSFIVWQDMDPRACIFFALGLGFTEVFIVIRWRLSIACPHCGFDPVLYKRSPLIAAERVNRHMALRRLDPLSAFAPPPPLPRIRKPKAENSSDARRLSRTV